MSGVNPHIHIPATQSWQADVAVDVCPLGQLMLGRSGLNSLGGVLNTTPLTPALPRLLPTLLIGKVIDLHS
ncbi:hypothetical protein B1F73_26390 [Pseudomonas syringae]|nr:hypothetical protein [Pseudomonas syringae pv. dysoxyli]PBP34735.1 hypothetical protein CCL12_09975 [Pseudomonas syringae]PBP41784.1 hypothetical protein CCL14_09090 [Pseudomonas syringae]PBP50751.1 hypothetical protein CCL13_00660 [Pseudomonas syringae]PBP59970.1 hypothetical protein CCL18_09845 [Pseudomonas syringae]